MFGDSVQSAWMMIHMRLGERKLDFYALQNSFKARVNPGECVMLRNKHGEAADLLEEEPLAAPPVCVKPASKPYMYKTDEGRDDDDDDDGADDETGEDFAEHEYGYGEYDYRHPGTSWESDDEDERGDNEIFSSLSTRAGQDLGSILLVGVGGTPAVELKAAYKLQLSVRLDEKRLALMYDAFEHKGPAFDPVGDPLPSNRSYQRFEDATRMGEPRGGYGGYDSDEDDGSADEADPSLDLPVEPTRELDENGRVGLHIRGHAGDFFASRVLRVRVPLTSVCGARLHSPDDANEPGLNRQALLVLELSEPPAPSAFAARKVLSEHQGEMEFVTVPDWTPEQAASHATRHYISGGADEIRALAAHLASISSKLATFLGRRDRSSAWQSSLAPPACLTLAEAPPFRGGSGQDASVCSGCSDAAEGSVPSLQALSAQKVVGVGASAVQAQDAGYPPAAVAAIAAAQHAKEKPAQKLSCDDVHELMQKRLGLSAKAARAANECFKKGVLRGHIRLDEGTTLQTVICSGKCICCRQPGLQCTIGQVLEQPTYGGDYEDGAPDGAVQCEDCCGMYVTGLCDGRAEFDSGKFHNHCTQCPDFGTCIGDHREAHCEDCGKHWFAGMSGFACSHCGGGRGDGRKTQPLSETPPPPPSAFDGVIEGAADKMRAHMADMEPLQRLMITKMLTALEPKGSLQTRLPADTLSAVLRGLEAAGDEGNVSPEMLQGLMQMMMGELPPGCEDSDDNSGSEAVLDMDDDCPPLELDYYANSDQGQAFSSGVPPRPKKGASNPPANSGAAGKKGSSRKRGSGGETSATFEY